MDIYYDNDYGRCEVKDIQLIIDESTWFERTSYDGQEKFVLKANPLFSKYKNEEVHR